MDVIINQALRIVSGTIKSTPLPWLSVLCNIAPSSIRRSAALKREFNKCLMNDTHPIHCDKDILPSSTSSLRLHSRQPSWISAHMLDDNFNINDKWNDNWETIDVKNKLLVNDVSDLVNGFKLPRKLWSTLNRIRTNHGKCKLTMYRWGLVDNTICNCGFAEQSIEHMIAECELTKFNGSLLDLHNLTPPAIEWLETVGRNLNL